MMQMNMNSYWNMGLNIIQFFKIILDFNILILLIFPTYIQKIKQASFIWKWARPLSFSAQRSVMHIDRRVRRGGFGVQTPPPPPFGYVIIFFCLSPRRSVW